MGTAPALTRALALHDSNSGIFSVEFSLAAVFPFGFGDLRRRGAARSAEIADPGYSGARSHRFDSDRDVNPAYGWLLRFPADMDFSCAHGDLAPFTALAAQF